MNPYMTNPYTQASANQISTDLTNNLQRNILPGINQQAFANGGVGGSRQGIAQGLAIGETNRAIGNAQSQLYSNAYNTDQQMALGNKQADNNYNLGLGGLGLNQQVSNQNFYTAQRGQDLQQASLGASLAAQGNQGLVNQGQQLWNTGQAQYQAPQNALSWYAQMLSPFTGLNNSTTQNTPGGSTLGGAVGGALTAAQLWKLLSGG